MTREKTIFWLKVIGAVTAAILGVLGVTNCTTSLNIQKHNTGSEQKVEQKQETSVDSTRIELKFNNNNK